MDRSLRVSEYEHRGGQEETVIHGGVEGPGALEAIAARHELHPNQVSAWRRQLLDAVSKVFAKGGRLRHAKIGELTVERDGPLSLSRECVLLGVRGSSLSYWERADNLVLIRRIDELHMDYPFYGSRHGISAVKASRSGVTGSGGLWPSRGWW